MNMAASEGNIRAIILTAIAILEIFLFAGPLYGWASIVPVLVKEGYFAFGCPPDAIAGGNITQAAHHCINREKKLNLAFTIACTTITVVQFPFGIMADRIPWNRLRAVGSIVFAIAGILWVASTEELEYLLFGGAAVLNMAGFFLYFPLVQLVNETLTENKSLVMSLLSGAYDSSAAVFSAIKVIYENGISFKQILIGYTLMGIIVTGGTTIFSVRFYRRRRCTRASLRSDGILFEGEKRYHRSLKEQGEEEISWLKRPAQYRRCLLKRELSVRAQRVMDIDCEQCESLVIKGEKSIWKYMLARSFVSQLIFLCLTNLRVMSYIGTLNTTLTIRLHCDMKTANKYLNIFGIIQFLGFPISMFIGPLLDGRLISQQIAMKKRRKWGGLCGLLLTNTIQLLLNVCALLPVLEVQVLTFMCHVTLRAFLFASHFSLLATLVPASHFGKLASFSLSCSGVFSAVQYLLFDLVEEVLNGDPLWVDVGFLIISGLLYLYPYKMYKLHTTKVEIIKETTL